MTARLLPPLLLLLAAAVPGAAQPLRIVEVEAPAINCIFDSDCSVTVADSRSEVAVPEGTGGGFLQTRLLPPGEPGTGGAGLHAYEYRLDLRRVRGITATICVSAIELDFGSIQPLDYDGDGHPEQVFLITSGGLGSVGLSDARRSGDRVTLRFVPAVCPGESSYFIGLASRRPPREVTASLSLSLGDGSLSVEARASPPTVCNILDLGTLGGTHSKASAINGHGQVVGMSETSAGETHAFLWEDGTMRDLGTLGGSVSVARDINDAGQVVGESTTSAGEHHTFLWEDGTMHDLGVLGGYRSNALGINSAGQIVGESTTSAGWYHAFLWEGGTMTDLGTLGGPVSFAYDINDAGQVVGGSDYTAFVWWEARRAPS